MGGDALKAGPRCDGRTTSSRAPGSSADEQADAVAGHAAHHIPKEGPDDHASSRGDHPRHPATA